jgi:dihydrofolate reductase
LKISIIAAIADDNVIGINNHLPWHLPKDLARFRKMIEGYPIVFGRKTWDGLVEQRIKIPASQIAILSKLNSLKLMPTFSSNVLCDSLEEAIYHLSKIDRMGEIFIGGGAQIYAAALPIVDTMYITRIDKKFEGDAFFPKINYNDWLLKNSCPFIEDKIVTLTEIYKRLSVKDKIWLDAL